MDEVLAEFLVESQENLDRIEQELIELERDPSQLARIAVIFRAIHSIKGTCGFLELRKLETVTHAGENLLVVLRDGELPLTPELASILLKLVDAVRKILSAVASTGQDGADTYPELIAKLNSLASPGVRKLVDLPPRPLQFSQVPPSSVKTPTGRANQRSSRQPERRRSQSAGRPPDSETGRQMSDSPSMRQSRAPRAPSSATGGQPRGTTTVRVDVKVLEELMTLVGELVLARNQLLELTRSHSRTPLAATCQRLNQITTDLQGNVMKTRMQPIGTVWNKFPRVARELAIQCGKRVNVDLQGSETELDKTVLEAISEPLTHIIRNAVDHGIESPEVRAKRGKPVEGNVRLSSGHKGGHVFIEIADDGAGINVERVKRKAIEKGLITEARAQQMTTVQAYQLLFAPGLSTAEKVTNISGRGVGMDVVRSKIERIGGSIEISSEPGRGSTFRVRLPLTLAIVPAVIVSCLGQRFAIPQQGLQELLRIGPNAEGVEYIQGAPVLRLRGRLLPLAWLSDLLGNEDSHRGSHHVIVLRSGETTFGLVVDEVANSEEIVVKPLANCLSGVNVYAGCTILGDGQVALILETTNLIARARKSESQAAVTTAEDSFTVAAASARQRFVLCEVGRARVAIPLDQVERLEKLHQGSLESRSGRAVIQYRGHVISVIRFEDGSDQFYDVESMADDSSRLHVLMHRSRGQQIAVVVNRIIDVVEQDVSEVQGSSTLIALGRVTELSDLRHLAPQSPGQPGNDVDNPVAEVA